MSISVVPIPSTSAVDGETILLNADGELTLNTDFADYRKVASGVFDTAASSLSFEGLEAGKIYRVRVNFAQSPSSTNTRLRLDLGDSVDGSTVLMSHSFYATGTNTASYNETGTNTNRITQNINYGSVSGGVNFDVTMWPRSPNIVIFKAEYGANQFIGFTRVQGYVLAAPVTAFEIFAESGNPFSVGTSWALYEEVAL